MGYAPIARIATAPDPATSGTTLTVEQDTGPRFPSPPFEALIWPTNTIPTEGVDSERPIVTAIDHDTFTLVRGESPIAITAGLDIAATHAIPTYDEGEIVRVGANFPLGGLEDAGTLHVRTPEGEVIEYVTADVTIDGAGSYHYDLLVEQGGFWFTQWKLDGAQSQEGKFFVKFGDV